MAQLRKLERPKDPRRQFPAIRDALRKRVFAMYDDCGICGHEVDKLLPPSSDMSPELDEIVPVSRGGSPYDIDNLQLAHRICNRRKGAKMAGDEEVKDLNPTPNSKQW